jgi:integrase/recombinase XerD
MARHTKFTPTQTAEGWRLNVPAKFTETGKRERHFYRTQREAKDAAKLLKESAAEFGHKSQAIKPSLAEDATAAAALLAPWSMTLIEAARMAVSFREREAASCSVKDALAAWIVSCEGLRKPTLATYGNTTRRLEAALGDRILSTLEAAEIQEGLGLVGTSGAAAANHHRAGRAFFRWAAKRGWCKVETFERVEAPRVDKNSEVEFLTLDECRKLLSTAAEHYPKAVAGYAILLFAGVRPSEFVRLRTEDVSVDGIEVNADSKIKKRRHITPCETLKAWLRVHPFKRISNWRRIDQAVRYLAGWDVWTDPDFFTPPPVSKDEKKKPRPTWPTDGTRHSFATYSINKGVTLDHFLWEFGHSGNTRTLKTHYLGRASKKQALEFFAIVPEGVEAPANLQPVESVA